MDSDSHASLQEEVRRAIEEDKHVLEQLREEIRPLRDTAVPIQTRSTTAISLVGTDGGNNRVQFDPFLVQLVRVVDSSNNEHCLEVVTPTSDVRRLSESQFDSDGNPITALGRMMSFLNVSTLDSLSPMIRPLRKDEVPKPSWVQVYRELVEWAILFELVRERDYGTDVLLLFDGLLRSKVFRDTLFIRYADGLREGIAKAAAKRRKIFLVGLAKHSKVLDRYRLAMSLEGVLTTSYPAYVEVPREVEEKAYVWSEYARGDERVNQGEVNKFVNGKMFLVKFGLHPNDPIWPVDIFTSQVSEVQQILGFLLADAVEGFPVPLYPRSLQRAHENAALVGFDFAVFQDRIFESMREALNEDAQALDAFQLRDRNPTERRY